MAKTEGTQSIPAELKYLYDGTVTPKTPDSIVRKRYKWRKPSKENGRAGVTTTEQEQRSRFLEIRNKFKNISEADRQRWYAARPIWHSLLWYYNYFMMSGLSGNAAIGGQGAGVIKSINHYTFTLPSGAPAPVTVSCSAIDPTKSVVFFYGAGWMDVVAGAVALVNPFLATLASSYAIVKASIQNGDNAGCSISIIEYI